jgi:hypothetical protein
MLADAPLLAAPKAAVQGLRLLARLMDQAAKLLLQLLHSAVLLLLLLQPGAHREVPVAELRPRLEMRYHACLMSSASIWSFLQ